ncbi:MAG: beta-ketoacyl-ACP synthase 3, partial [Parvibaculaceae bacterium]|nr:beta-ketoacyl-ACP synthase 3 [Parvibaculaceae bacterium]
MTCIRSVVAGCGSYLPERVVTNEDLSKFVDTTDEWIVSRSGIHQRHLAADGELTSDLGLAAAQAALDDAGLTVDDIDLIVMATTTPDDTFPATATKIQMKLGMHHGAAFDIQAVCSGFVYAMSVADNFIKSGQSKGALVIGAETFSRLLDWEDRTTCVLFGDGAGAVVLKPEEAAGELTDRGMLTAHLHSDGRHRDKLYVDGGPSSTQTVGHVRMIGKDVFRHAVVNIADAIQEALEATGYTIDDI